MAVIKCRFCGMDTAQTGVSGPAVCRSCGLTSTVQLPIDPRLAAELNRGHYYRRQGEFARAETAFTEIIEKNKGCAEAYFGRALSRYGVLYESADDGSLRTKCARGDRERFPTDPDYREALCLASESAAEQYRLEASWISGVSENSASEYVKQAFACLEREKWEEAEKSARLALKTEPENARAWLAVLMCGRRCAKPENLKDTDRPLDADAAYRNVLQYGDPTLCAVLERCNRYIIGRKQNGISERDYQKAVALMEHAASPEDYRSAWQLFSGLSGYRDSAELAEKCLRRMKNIRKPAAASAEEKPEPEVRSRKEKGPAYARTAEKKSKKHFRWPAAFAILLVLGLGTWLLVTKLLIPMQAYRAADRLLAEGNKAAAIAAFQNLSGFRDSEERAGQIQKEWYSEAELFLESGSACKAAAAFGGLGDYLDSRERSLLLWQTIVSPVTVSAGGRYSVALHSTGAEAVGDNRDRQCELGTWENVISISAGWSHTVGRRADGSVVSAGYNGDGRGEAAQWQNIVDISAGQWHTVGLLSDGTVIGTGCADDGRLDVGEWCDVMAVSAGRNHTVALFFDGTAAAVGRNEESQCEISAWNSLTAVSAGGEHTLGLRTDGTVVAAGSDFDGQCNVSGWKNIIAVSAGYYHSVGLCADGTVVAAGNNYYGQCDVSGWKNVVAVSAGGWHTLGLCADGTVLSTGCAFSGQCDTAEWADILLPG